MKTKNPKSQSQKINQKLGLSIINSKNDIIKSFFQNKLNQLNNQKLQTNNPIVTNKPIGTKRLLSMCFNYERTKFKLNGCFNDGINITKYFKKIGYTDITLITDKTTNWNKINVTNQILKFIKSGVAGDTLIFHYSGHGTQIPDNNGDEKLDRVDECIVCSNIVNGQPEILRDDEFNDIIGNLADGVNLVIVTDSCNSGTVTDLPYTFEPTQPNNYVVNNTRFINTKNIIALSGCRDNQTSADANIPDNLGNKAQGAMTWALLQALNNKQATTWRQLLTNIRTILSNTKLYDQVPQLSYSNIKFNIDNNYIL